MKERRGNAPVTVSRFSRALPGKPPVVKIPIFTMQNWQQDSRKKWSQLHAIQRSQ